MAVDRNGETVVAGQIYLVAGPVRRIDGDTVVIVLDSGEVVRAAAADICKVDDALAGLGGGVTDHGDLTGLGNNDHPHYALVTYVDAVDAAIVGGTVAALAGKQDLDATLTALAGLTTAAGQVTKWTGVDTATTITLGSFGETMLATASAAAGRTALAVDEVYSDAPMQNIAVNVVAYTDLLSKSLTVAAGDTIEVVARGTLKNDSAALRTYRVQAEIAVVPNVLQCEVIDGGSIAASATNQAEWWIRATFSVKNASSSGLVLEVDRGVPSAANTGASTAGTTVRRGWQESSSDFTGAATIELRMRSDNAAATQTFKLHSWSITRRPQRL